MFMRDDASRCLCLIVTCTLYKQACFENYAFIKPDLDSSQFHFGEKNECCIHIQWSWYSHWVAVIYILRTLKEKLEINFNQNQNQIIFASLFIIFFKSDKDLSIKVPQSALAIPVIITSSIFDLPFQTPIYCNHQYCLIWCKISK